MKKEEKSCTQEHDVLLCVMAIVPSLKHLTCYVQKFKYNQLLRHSAAGSPSCLFCVIIFREGGSACQTSPLSNNLHDITVATECCDNSPPPHSLTPFPLGSFQQLLPKKKTRSDKCVPAKKMRGKVNSSGR